jgi:hypothetical protein
VFQNLFVIDDINAIEVSHETFIEILKELGYISKKLTHFKQKDADLLADAWDCIKTEEPETTNFMNIAVFLSLINNVYIEKEKVSKLT